ncbi:HNH endonuclease [Polaribacter undariae]|uniref:HNH endonuclease n=1 Tax=Polaribacter sejongensis TaxID=985043 RepID=A0AAJ1QXG1_9FLAO|nr:HNH endonuclease [Polaribacter undariae]MDN3620108.1 HNH endonuclease [Polaribacter undariae]UWD32511.1 HNH endonuclease [Polaribacter undariae]
MKNYIILILCFYSFNAIHSQYKTQAYKSLTKIAKKGAAKGSSEAIEYSSKKISKEVINTIITSTYKRERRKAIASKLTKDEFVTFIERSGFSHKEAEKVFLKLGKENNRMIYSLISNDTPIALRKILIEDASAKPQFFKIIYNDPKLLNSFELVYSMGRKYRTDLKILNKVYKREFPIDINTIVSNGGLNKYGVKYFNKIITLTNGIKIRGYFPDFINYTIFQTKIPQHRLLKSDASQFNYAFLKFQKNLKINPEMQKKFTRKELKELLTRKLKSTKSESTSKVPGYTWHHNESGFLQLVETKVHNDVKHTGDRALKGGGKEIRKSIIH